ncbi:hypothetical protein Godav_026707 [Gossypium davidsonii]|uniref:Uncharacterized protein n=2 Tax=Gossypium TaxID=3633 RepID=A0A7J8RUD7_GOSDV|nr:hypothetical protein [Gossypium davidsonii]MBA0652555.1 hypothetical protein [Gossypium klotzschianum]
MESFKQVKGNGGVIDQTMEDAGATNPRVQWKQIGYEEKTITGFDDLLPSCLCQIIALQEEELELLFVGLSL